MIDTQARARAFWTEVFNAQDLGHVEDFVAPEMINHNARPGTPNGPDGVRELCTRLWTGFSDMRFVVHAMSPDDYAKWLAGAKDRGPVLDTAAYAALAQQSSDVKAAAYHGVDAKLFSSIVDETAPASGGVQEQPGGHSSSPAGGG